MVRPVAAAMGATTLKSIQYSGSGVNFAVGQSFAPGLPWPRFNVKSYTRAIDYETSSLRDELVRTQAEAPPRGGGMQPVRGEQQDSRPREQGPMCKPFHAIGLIMSEVVCLRISRRSIEATIRSISFSLSLVVVQFWVL